MALQLSDVQGLVFHAYRRHPHARYVLLRFRNDAAAARQWLADLLSSIDSATPKDAGPERRPGVRLNIAFTYSGLQRLGLPADGLHTFPTAFVEGLGRAWCPNRGADHRSRILGDVGESAPDAWAWGYQPDPQRRVDALLMVFGTDLTQVIEDLALWTNRAAALCAIEPGAFHELCGTFPRDLRAKVREPFGFVDGVSQPVLKSGRSQLRIGERRSQPEIHELEDGEILMGHRDGARQWPSSPTISADHDVECVLPDAPSDEPAPPQRPPRRDLGHNGTYLVFRQMSQDVAGFEEECASESARQGMDVERYKALLVGRWRDGSPLISCPVAHNPALADAPAGNDFRYADDPFGQRCPIGAHIRRANPRDSLVSDPTVSWRVTNRHRLLRRGRPYKNGNEEGLHFIALNADIVRQFEFIQQNWLNDLSFGGLDNEVDPLIGQGNGASQEQGMRLPPPPEHRVPGRTSFSRYVTVRGGGYFFLPSLTTLRYLAGVASPAPPVRGWEPAPRAASRADIVRLLAHGRFSFLLATVLALAPLALFIDNPGLRALLEPMFRFNAWWELGALTLAASLTAGIGMITWRTVQLYAGKRFGLNTGLSSALTWGRVLRWQALSLPWIACTLYLSLVDATRPMPKVWRVRPIRWGELTQWLKEMVQESPWWLLAILLGYLISYAVMWVAEYVRGRGVTEENSEPTVILPPTRRRHQRQQTPSILEGARVVNFLGAKTAQISPERARGYVDHETGRILAGHVSGLALFLVSGVLYLLGRFLFRPGDLFFGAQLPSSVYLLFLLSAATFVSSAAAFWLDRYRVPLLLLVVAWLVVSTNFRDGDHRFSVIDPRPARSAIAWDRGPSIVDAITSADDHAWRNGRATAKEAPVIVVAAGGGGGYQSAWVARVLTGLTELWGAAFAQNVRLISATSGGSIGVMHFVDRYDYWGFAEGRAQLSSIVDAAASPATADIWWGLTYFDFPRVLPLRFERDRGWALERAWQRAFRRPNEQRTLSEWRHGVAAGWRPATAFNAMAVETGQRVVLATYTLPAGSAAHLGTLIAGHDIDLVTAARLSASFPIVTPFARAAGDSVTHHLADGGYWDNHGLLSMLEWLEAANSALDTRHVIVIRIPPPAAAPPEPRDQSWVWQASASVLGLESMRVNAQKARNDRDLETYRRERDARRATLKDAPSKTFAAVEFSSGGSESLSWHLSRAERCTIERQWRNFAGSPQLTALESLLGSQQAMPEMPEQCRP